MALNVLLVDDSATVRAVLKKMLLIGKVPIGEILEAENGREALGILDDNWIDLLFTDLNMPEMSGVELIEAMGENGSLESIPVIIVSTEGSATLISTLRSRGVEGYVRKPFTPDRIRRVVDDVLGVKSETEQDQLVNQAFCDVLEKVAYMFAEPVARTKMPTNVKEGFLAKISFSGPATGSMDLAAPLTMCRSVAANMLGMEQDDEFVDDRAGDALREVLSITCGHILTAISGVRPIYDMTPPEMLSMDDTDWSAMLSSPETSSYVVEDSPVLLRLSLAS